MFRVNFNHQWSFSFGKCHMLDTSGNNGRLVNLPYDAMIREKRSEKNPSTGAGGYYPGGSYSYSKRFNVAQEDLGKTFLLEVEGAYRYARVYLNGALLNTCQNGYRGFFTDLTPQLKIGEENLLELKISNNDQPNSRWYTGSGLYRPVWLWIGGDAFLEPDSVQVTTPNVGRVSTVEIRIPLIVKTGHSGFLTVETKLLDEGGEICGEAETSVALPCAQNTVLHQKIYLTDAKLWSVEHPHLYNCSIKVRNAEMVLDCALIPFGIRRVQVDPVNGMRLNGEKVNLRGACIHHDNGVIGAISTVAVEKRRVSLLKEAGFNAIRMSHNSASKALLTACDQVGMLLLEEVFDVWNNSKVENDSAQYFLRDWESDVEAVIRKDFNHPSVIIYSIGNEIQELGTAQGDEWNRRLVEKFHSLDQTRLVTNAVNGLVTVLPELPRIIRDMNLDTDADFTDNDINAVMTALMGRGNELSAHPLLAERLDGVFSELDVCGYNYMRGRYLPDAKCYPNRIILGTETYGPDIDLNWALVKQCPQIIGDFTWTGWDYIGEAGIGVVGYNGPGGFASRYPTFLAYVGDIDLTGNRRPISYYREIVWGLRNKPYIAVQDPQHFGAVVMKTPWVTEEMVASWTWPGREGSSCMVEVYSAAPKVELYRNGEYIGSRAAGEANRFKACFQLEYQPGELKCLSWFPDGSCETTALQTAGPVSDLRLEPYGQTTCIEVDEILYIRVLLTDAEGRLNPAQSEALRLTLEGTGELLGFGSANPKGTDNFSDDSCTAWQGQAVAAIRGIAHGTVRIKAESKTMVSEWLEVKVL